MTVFKGGEAIKEFLKEFDSWLSASVTVYLLGGSAMTVRGVNYPTLLLRRRRASVLEGRALMWTPGPGNQSPAIGW